MKLFYTPNSPYARIARVTALELGLWVGVARRRHRNDGWYSYWWL